jgi:hypothetical protein
MPYTKQWMFTKNADTNFYTSSAISAYTTDLKISGDIVSTNRETVSPTQTRLTIVFRDEASFNSWTNWIQSNEVSSIDNYHSANNINVESL